MSTSPKIRTRATWVLRVVVALVFLAAAAAKLSGAPQMVQIFDMIGAGQWFRYVTGLVEVAGAVLLLVPRRGAWGATLLAATMACAVFTHLAIIGGNPAPAIVLLVLTVALAVILRPSTFMAARDGVLQ